MHLSRLPDITTDEPSQSKWSQVAALGRIIAPRLLQAVFTLLGASMLIWALLPLAPGDPALRLLQQRGIPSPLPAEIAALRTELGLDRPLQVQYLQWLGRAVRGDLSTSYMSKRPVLSELGRRFPATLLLTATSLLIALLITLPAALLAAAYRGRWPDHVVQSLTQIGASVPAFLLGLLALNILVIDLGWGRVIAGGAVDQLWLPALCLAIRPIADWTQLLRANLLEALGAHYTLVATSRGATRLRVLVRYALPNATLPFLTAVGIGIGSLIGGAPIIEAVFTWPGIGSYVVTAIIARDLPVVQGFVLISVLAYISASFLTDLAGALLDPRVRTGGNI